MTLLQEYYQTMEIVENSKETKIVYNSVGVYNDYNVEDTDFYQNALDRVESAIHILQKIEGAGYSHESAEEISKRIVLFALKSADDTNDK